MFVNKPVQSITPALCIYSAAENAADAADAADHHTAVITTTVDDDQQSQSLTVMIIQRKLIPAYFNWQELELRIETQKQTMQSRDESIKKLLEMLQNKGSGKLLPFTKPLVVDIRYRVILAAALVTLSQKQLNNQTKLPRNDSNINNNNINHNKATATTTKSIQTQLRQQTFVCLF